jgi:hypothetical protein
MELDTNLGPSDVDDDCCVRRSSSCNVTAAAAVSAAPGNRHRCSILVDPRERYRDVKPCFDVRSYLHFVPRLLG